MPEHRWMYQVETTDPKKWVVLENLGNAVADDVAVHVAASHISRGRIVVNVASQSSGNLHHNGAPRCVHRFLLAVG